MSINAFILRWAASGAAERANYQLFLSELCDVLAVARPDRQAADDAANAYVFEKPAPLPHGTTGCIDLYKRGCFVLEAKQGSDRLPPPPPNPDRQGGAANIRRRGTATRGTATRGTATRGTATWDTAMERAREQALRRPPSPPRCPGRRPCRSRRAPCAASCSRPPRRSPRPRSPRASSKPTRRAWRSYWQRWRRWVRRRPGRYGAV